MSASRGFPASPLDRKPAPARPADTIRDAEQRRGRRLAETDQHFRIDQFDLALDERQADRRSRAARDRGFPAAAMARYWRYRRLRASIPIAASILSSNCPERPTNGMPCCPPRDPAPRRRTSAALAGCRRAKTSCLAVVRKRAALEAVQDRAQILERGAPFLAASRAAIMASSGGGGAAVAAAHGMRVRGSGAGRRSAGGAGVSFERCGAGSANRSTGASPSSASTPASA